MEARRQQAMQRKAEEEKARAAEEERKIKEEAERRKREREEHTDKRPLRSTAATTKKVRFSILDNVLSVIPIKLRRTMTTLRSGSLLPLRRRSRHPRTRRTRLCLVLPRSPR